MAKQQQQQQEQRLALCGMIQRLNRSFVAVQQASNRVVARQHG
jgi:hypothetical protein